MLPRTELHCMAGADAEGTAKAHPEGAASAAGSEAEPIELGEADTSEQATRTPRMRACTRMHTRKHARKHAHTRKHTRTHARASPRQLFGEAPRRQPRSQAVARREVAEAADDTQVGGTEVCEGSNPRSNIPSTAGLMRRRAFDRWSSIGFDRMFDRMFDPELGRCGFDRYVQRRRYLRTRSFLVRPSASATRCTHLH